MQETAQYFEKRIFCKQVLDFHSLLKILCHTFEIMKFCQNTGPLQSSQLWLTVLKKDESPTCAQWG
jgi:hypothetical protein